MASKQGCLRLAAVGDAIVNRRVSKSEDERFESVIDKIRESDVSFVNLETLLHDYEGYPTGVPAGTYMRAPPWVADELTWAGFDLFAAATNHANDYSHGGMEATMRELRNRNITYAGLGENLADAREPSYIDTSAGRVALVAACSTFPPGTAAGEQRRDMQGRPGISPLRHNPRYIVPSDTLEHLRKISESLGLEKRKQRYEQRDESSETADNFRFLNLDTASDLKFSEGDQFRVQRFPSKRDMKAILKTIRNAKRQADWVIMSLHAHEGAGTAQNDHSVPKFVERFARSCIDIGADAFVSHGPHVLRGIEIYEDAPIFYSLGNFLLQNQTVTRLPAEAYEKYDLDRHEASPADVYDERVSNDGSSKAFLDDDSWWESVLPICEFADGTLERITIHPLNLLPEQPRPRRGRPVRAEGEKATKILHDLSRFSRPYDTEIEIENGVGIISA